MRQIIEQAQQGDGDALNRLFRQYYAMAHTAAYGKLQDHDLAEEAVQEAFAEAFVHLSRLQQADAFPGWLRTIVHRQCYRLIRRKPQTSALEEGEVTAPDQPDIGEVVARQELYRMLHDSVQALSPGMREAVQLFYFHGYSLQEISEYAGTPVTALKKRLFDARRKLRGTLPVADFAHVFKHLHEGGKRMLHIVNGDTVAETLKQGVVQGDILVWREVYPEGPVFLEPAEPESRAVRARYLEKDMGIPADEYIRNCEEQEQKLAGFRQYDEIVLWFEHDLFDQTMLSYLLHWFGRQSLGGTKLNLLCIGDYPGVGLFRGLGQLTASQLKTLSGTWHHIGAEELKLGSRVWEAYTSPDPMKLQQLLEEDTSALPFVREAFELHLSRFPSVYNGLGIVEQMTLEKVSEGIHSPLDLFRQIGDRLHGLGMGDLQYWDVLRSLCQGPSPLLTLEGVESFPGYTGSSPAFRDSKVQITEWGTRVLRGEDYLEQCGIDRWYGGVHLSGDQPVWRWDQDRKKLVKCGE